MEPSIILIAIDGPIARADIPALCDRVRTRLDDAGPGPVLCDVHALTSPDAAAVDALARLLLTCRRLGLEVHFNGASAELVELVTLAGLRGVLPLTGRSGVKARGQPKQRKQGGGVEEEGDPGDTVR